MSDEDSFAIMLNYAALTCPASFVPVSAQPPCIIVAILPPHAMEI
jgi:hypothetical protein